MARWTTIEWAQDDVTASFPINPRIHAINIYDSSGNKNRRRVDQSYDAAGNLTYDGWQSFTYDATGAQVQAPRFGVWQGHDGDGWRVKNVDGPTTYYLHSTVLGGQVVAEIDSNVGWARGYVYAGDQLVALQQGDVYLVHQDPVTKSQRLTDPSGNVVAAIELDPYGGETDRSSNQYAQPHRYTTWERNSTGDESLFRRYHGWFSRFAHPDPSDGSYDFTDPQSFNRYAYVQSDPVNFTDPSGLAGPGDHDNPVIFPCLLLDGVDTCQGAHIIPNAFSLSVFRVHGPEQNVFNVWLTPLLPQNPYDIRKIISEAKDTLRKKELNKQAWTAYANCVRNSPESKAYEQAFNKAALRASLPIPGGLGIGKATYRTASGVAAGRGIAASLITSSNVFTLAFSAALNMLIANPAAETQGLWDKVKLVQQECLKQIQGKYGFKPVDPY